MADDLTKLRDAVRPYEEYRSMLDKVADPAKEDLNEFSSTLKSIGMSLRDNFR